jgi:hypothetical protein
VIDPVVRFILGFVITMLAGMSLTLLIVVLVIRPWRRK